MSIASPADVPLVVRPGHGLDAPIAELGAIHKVWSEVVDGRVAIVEYTLAPGRLAVPLHRHSREDELSFVVSGQMGAMLGDEVILAGAGVYVLKPRGQWHTFWNGGVGSPEGARDHCTGRARVVRSTSLRDVEWSVASDRAGHPTGCRRVWH